MRRGLPGLCVVVVHFISPSGFADCCRLSVWETNFTPTNVYILGLGQRREHPVKALGQGLNSPISKGSVDVHRARTGSRHVSRERRSLSVLSPIVPDSGASNSGRGRVAIIRVPCWLE